jgi:hypothetical protein
MATATKSALRFRLLDDRTCIRYQDPKMPIGQGYVRWYRRGDEVDFDGALGYDPEQIERLIAMGCLGQLTDPVVARQAAELPDTPDVLGNPFAVEHADEQ